MSKMGNFKAIVSDVKDAIRNTFVKMANALSGRDGARNESGKLKEIEILFRLEGDFERLHKECGHLENIKNVADFEKGGAVIQLQKEMARKEEFAKSN